MSIVGLLIGIVVLAVLGGTLAVTSTIPFVCGAFAFCFWGSLAILIGSFIWGIVRSSTKNDTQEFDAIAGSGFIACLYGLGIAVVIFVLAFLVDGARVFLSLLGLDAGQDPITMYRMFFPWAV